MEVTNKTLTIIGAITLALNIHFFITHPPEHRNAAAGIGITAVLFTAVVAFAIKCKK